MSWQVNPYEIGSAAAALQNGFKKRCKRATKWVTAALPNFGYLNAVTGSGLIIVAGPCSHARNHACKKNVDFLDNLFI